MTGDGRQPEQPGQGPLATVVVPAYEPGPRLREALESVLAQGEPADVVVVDDGSTEDLSWVGSLAPGRVRLLRQPNRGVSVARNVGVRAARTPLVAFLDQDDTWRADKLERQLDGWRARPDASFHCTGFTWALPGGDLPSEPTPPSLPWLLSTGHVCLSSVLVPVEHYWMVGGHDPTLRMMQDFDLFLRLMLVLGPPAMVPEPLVRYAVHDANASRDYAAAARERLRVLGDHEALAAHRGDLEAVRAVAAGRRRTAELYAHQAVDAARREVRAGRVTAGLRHGVRAVGFSPRVAGSAVTRGAARRLRRREG